METNGIAVSLETNHIAIHVLFLSGSANHVFAIMDCVLVQVGPEVIEKKACSTQLSMKFSNFLNTHKYKNIKKFR